MPAFARRRGIDHASIAPIRGIAAVLLALLGTGSVMGEMVEDGTRHLSEKDLSAIATYLLGKPR
jgi:hypothetical protein